MNIFKLQIEVGDYVDIKWPVHDKLSLRLRLDNGTYLVDVYTWLFGVRSNFAYDTITLKFGEESNLSNDVSFLYHKNNICVKSTNPGVLVNDKNMLTQY